MSSDNQDTELEAIRTCLQALAGLDDGAKKRVVTYLIERLDLDLDMPSSDGARKRRRAGAEHIAGVDAEESTHIVDIRTLKDRKQPDTAVEMAVLVAYYLSEYAPIDERSSTVSTDHLETYFKQAAFPLPGSMRHVLPNAKKSGYMDNVSRGEYKLTPVGYNLAVHGLPKKSSE